MPSKKDNGFAHVCYLKLFLHPINNRKQSGKVAKDDRPSGRALSVARDCINALHALAGVVPGCGSQIQAVLEIGATVLDRMEQVRILKEQQDALCYKISYVLTMIENALNGPYAKRAPDLQNDLQNITNILQEILQYVEQRATSKRHSISRILTCASDYNRLVEFGIQMDEAVKNLTIKSLIQLRQDVEDLKEAIKESAKDLELTVKASAENLKGTFESSTEDLKKALQSSAVMMESLKESLNNASIVRFPDRRYFV